MAELQENIMTEKRGKGRPKTGNILQSKSMCVVRPETAKKLELAHLKYQYKQGSKISMIEFVDMLINKGLEGM
jgi:hypothetical protein